MVGMGVPAVRSFVALVLMGMILACPFLCGVGEDPCAAIPHHAGGATDGPSPGHCPEDGDDCICRGAVQPSEVRVPRLEGIGLRLDVLGLAAAPAHSPAHSLARLTPDGHPTGLA